MGKFQNNLQQHAPGRRQFLKLAGLGGAGLVIGLRLDPRAALAQQSGTPALSYNAFVSVTPDNQVRVLIKHLEMGQGIYTGLATCVAEEMDADWSQIVCEHAPADTEKYANLGMGLQATGGSTGMANSYQQMREAGAAARAMLVMAAAQHWNVPVADISVAAGVVRHGPHSATFGELAAAAAAQTAPAVDSLVLKNPSEFIYIGNPDLPRKDIGKNTGDRKSVV